MRVASKSCAGLDSVLVEHAQVPEPPMIVIAISKHEALLSALTALVMVSPCKNMRFQTHEANSNVWNVLSQPWSAWPLSAEGLRTNLVVDMFS